ncbi:MAG: hypothetical protein CL878_05270 [Dehalococcoidia bacterium]|nr:hypothetical protein [Dehalococcoidia bacterium]
MGPGERLVGVTSLGAHTEAGSLVLFSRGGKIKRSLLTEYQSADSRGVVDLKLAPGDEVIAATLAREDDDCLLLSSAGKVLRFPLAAVRATGRGTQGVVGMSLPRGTHLVSATTAEGRAKSHVILLTTAGVVKKVPLREFPRKGRATGGVAGVGLTRGRTAASLAVAAPGSHVILNAAKQVVRLAADELTTRGRSAKGTQVLPAFDAESASRAAILVLS